MDTIRAGRLEIDAERLRALCEKWRIAQLAVFGSVLREDFGPESDVDVLVTPAAGMRWRYEDLWDMKTEIAEIFGREVDIAQRALVEADANHIRRARILAESRPLYAA